MENNNIKIEKIGDISSEFPYLEISLIRDKTPFFDISISEEKELLIKILSNSENINVTIFDLEYIIQKAKEFLSKSIKDENDFMTFMDN